MLQVKDLTVRYGGLTIVDHVSFSVEEGQWVMLIGPNGAGKSTIVNALSQGVSYTGRVLFEGGDVAKMKSAHRAKLLGVLEQSHHVAYSFTVEEVVKLGRYCYSPGVFNVMTEQDIEHIDGALHMTGMQSQRTQSVLTLSGGELQRTFLAQLLAQNPRLLILDEPTSHLDLVYQQQVFGLLGEWLQKPGRALLSVVHDLGLARAYGSHAILLHRGKIISSGAVRDVTARQRLRMAYQMDVYGWMRNLLSQWEE